MDSKERGFAMKVSNEGPSKDPTALTILILLVRRSCLQGGNPDGSDY